MLQRKTADDRKAEIVATTLRLADELGPDRLTTHAVANAVGLTQPGIFRHFPTKHDLWLAVATHIAAGLSDAWAEALGQDLAPQQRLARLMQAQLGQIAANPAIPAILTSRELHSENAALRDKFTSLMQQFQAILFETLRQGQADGSFRADLDPQDAAVLLISLIQGLAIRWSLGQRTFSLKGEGGRLMDRQLALFAPFDPQRKIA